MIIVAALVALIQVGSARSGGSSPLSATGTTLAAGFEWLASGALGNARSGLLTLLELPALERKNGALAGQNARLTEENSRLAEQLVAYKEQVALQPQIEEYRGGIQARVIGFPPENANRTLTLDKGSRAGIARDDGVLAAGGVVGRVVEVGPFTSKIALITDFESKIPAVVQRGRFWGIAAGNDTSVRLEYVSQDAPIRVGDKVVTGEARSFHSGATIGTIESVEHGNASLYQTAVVKPSVDLNSLERVVVVPK
ncbi:MAG: rod shape-determining protein MreC [Candidatus Eremiobacteraeota bacterium]|nr:rod shape-determining protein MreC [Candidatus Eremiobacteraeota bacterium]